MLLGVFAEVGTKGSYSGILVGVIGDRLISGAPSLIRVRQQASSKLPEHNIIQYTTFYEIPVIFISNSDSKSCRAFTGGPSRIPSSLL